MSLIQNTLSEKQEKPMPVKLYRYFSTIDYAIKAINNEELYFSLSTNFNDVFDCRLVNNGEVFDANQEGELEVVLNFVNGILLSCSGFFMDFFSKGKNFDEMVGNFKDLPTTGDRTTPNEYLKFIHVFSERKDAFDSFLSLLRASYLQNQPIISIPRRVACFSEVYDSILMWSYYADKHQGVCLEYEPMLLKEKGTEYSKVLNSLHKVHYSTKQINNTLLMNSLDDIEKVFFTKAQCWLHEQEWRIVLDENIEKISFPCLTGIYLGVKFRDKYSDGGLKNKFVQVVSSACSSNGGIALYEMRVDNSEYKINRQELISSGYYRSRNKH